MSRTSRMNKYLSLSRTIALRAWGRRLRALVRPMGSVPDHLGATARRTAEGLGLDAGTARHLEMIAHDTCREAGLGGTTTTPHAQMAVPIRDSQ